MITMAKLKAFYAGQNYPINEEIRQLLRLPTHRRFGHGLIVAPSKAQAVAFVEGLRRSGQPVSAPYPAAMRVSTSPDTEGLRQAGLLDEEAVFITSADTSTGPVVRVTAGGYEVVGHMVHVDGSYRRHFESVGTLHVTFTPDAVQAFHALLDLVHYDGLALEWRAMLPAELLAAREGAAVSDTTTKE